MNFSEKELLFTIEGVYRIKRDACKIETEQKSCSVLSYRLDGSSTFLLKNDTFSLHKGDVLFIPENATYSQETEGEEIIAIQLDLRNPLPIKFLHFSALKYELQDLFLQVYDLWQKKEPGNYCKCLSIVYDIFSRTIQNHEIEIREEEKSSKYQAIDASIRFLKQHFAEANLSIGDIAKKSGVSEVYFRRIFKEIFHTSPNKYRNNLRITNSLPLIRSGFYSMEEIATMVGFRDAKYFAEAFKAEMNYSPQQYKKHASVEKIR